MHNASGGSLHRRVHNSNKSSALFRREAEQLGAAVRDRERHINSAAEITWFSSALNTQNSLGIFVGVVFHWVGLLSVSLFYFCVCSVLEASPPPHTHTHTHSLAVNPVGDPLLCSHIKILLDFCRLYTREPVWESPHKLHSLTRAFAFTHAHPVEKYGVSEEFIACLTVATDNWKIGWGTECKTAIVFQLNTFCIKLHNYQGRCNVMESQAECF